MSALTTELESTWQREIPLAAAMGIEIVSYIDDELVVRAALEPNRNVHGTAFAGSLYAICALTGWGLLWLQLRARNLDASIVLAEASIRYRKAVTETIVCRCRFDAELQGPNLGQLERTGSGLFPLLGSVDTAMRQAVRFEGEYAAKLRGGASDLPKAVPDHAQSDIENNG